MTVQNQETEFLEDCNSQCWDSESSVSLLYYVEPINNESHVVDIDIAYSCVTSFVIFIHVKRLQYCHAHVFSKTQHSHSIRQ